MNQLAPARLEAPGERSGRGSTATRCAAAGSRLRTACTTCTRRPHLVHVFPSFDIGGVQVRFAALAEGLGRRYRHTVVSLNGQYGAAALVAPNAPVAYRDAPPRSRATPGRILGYRSLIADLRPDLLLTHNWGSMEVVFANAFVRAPHIHLEDGFGPEEADRQLPRRVWTRRIALARSQVVVPSATLRDIAIGRWGLDDRRVAHIPNGIAASDREQAAGRLGFDLPPSRLRIAWAGALRREKNPLRLLRAFAPLKERAVLLLIGDGPERAAVVAEAERLGLGASLRLLGVRSDARQIIAQSDLLALSSDTEQMPLVVLEAMEAGLPIVATDVGDVRLMVAEENRRFVVPGGSDAFTGALRALLLDPELRSRVGRANLARQRDLYTLPRMIEAYGSVFEKVGGLRG